MVISKSNVDLLPQKEPFVFVDGIVDYQKNGYLITMKRFTTNDAMLRNQACQQIPCTLIMEGAAQSIIIFQKMNENVVASNKFMLIGKLEAEFTKEVNIGDSIYYCVENLKLYNDTGIATVKITTDTLDKVNIGGVTVFFKIKEIEL